MSITIRLIKLALVLGAILLISGVMPASAQDDSNQTPVNTTIAPSNSQIRPLLIGATVPSVAVADANGEPVNLKELVSGQPTILIFYRGGW